MKAVKAEKPAEAAPVAEEALAPVAEETPAPEAPVEETKPQAEAKD